MEARFDRQAARFDDKGERFDRQVDRARDKADASRARFLCRVGKADCGGDGYDADVGSSSGLRSGLRLKDRLSSFLNRENTSTEPERRSQKRIALPVRVEPKVFFANERTFLSWLHCK